MSARKAAVRPSQIFEVAAFDGIRDQRSAKYKPGEMEAIYNLVPESPDRPGPLWLRPGFKRCKPSANTTANQLDVAGIDTRIRWAGFVPFVAGAKFILVAKDAVYSLSLSTFALTLELSAANLLTTGSYALSGFAGAVVFNSKLVLANATVRPITWNGTTGAGMAQIANATAGFCGPTVYAGKLFFRCNTAPTTIFWSEEADETIGYGVAPYTSNLWILAQVSQVGLGCIIGTESGLLFLRDQQPGVGMIRGEVDANFKTNATRDDISTTVGYTPGGGASGQIAPDYGEHAILFFDHENQPTVYREGQGCVPLWEQLPRFYRTNAPQSGSGGLDTAPWAYTDLPAELGTSALWSPLLCFYDRQTSAHVFAIGNGSVAMLLFFDARSDRLLSIWTTPLLSHGGFANITGGAAGIGRILKVDDQAFVYMTDLSQQQNTASNWNDEISNGPGTPVVGTVLGPPAGWNLGLDLHWLEAGVTVEARGTHSCRFGYVTSLGHKGALAPASQLFTETGLTNTPYERSVVFGLAGYGRWLRPQIQVSAAAGALERPGLYGYRLEAIADDVGTGNY